MTLVYFILQSLSAMFNNIQFNATYSIYFGFIYAPIIHNLNGFITI